jgi:hypothetical protein
VVAAAYSLGPVTLYLMAACLGDRGGAFLAALLYSLFSPSALLMPNVARDVGGIWFGRRLQVLTAYGEGPHISAMTLLPLAIMALAYALHRRSGRAFGLAAVALAAVLLTNVPGTMGLGLAVFCWIASQPSGSRRDAWILAGAATVLAYAIACYGIPPSSELTVLKNIGPMHRGFSVGLKSGPILLAVLLAAVYGAGHVLLRTRLSLLVRFALLYFILTAAAVLTARPNSFELLPQAGRLHLEMEMGFCLMAGAAAAFLYRRTPHRLRLLLLLFLATGAYLQVNNYRRRASIDIRPANLAARSEYASARWADAHLAGQRVYVSGSDSFWWNTFTDVPQVMGCCEQGQSLRILGALPFLIDSPTGPYHELLTKAYLQAFGAQAIVVSGPRSTDEFKDIQSPERFDAFLPVLHRQLGDTIYAVPQRSPSLAHVLRPGEAIPATATPNEVYNYSLVIEDATRPAADFQWLGDGVARIRAELTPTDLVSVQVAWFSGWKAWVGERRIPISADGLGLQVLHPGCQGACEITLRWTGRPDTVPAALVSLAALAFLGVLLVRNPTSV